MINIFFTLFRHPCSFHEPVESKNRSLLLRTPLSGEDRGSIHPTSPATMQDQTYWASTAPPEAVDDMVFRAQRGPGAPIRQLWIRGADVAAGGDEGVVHDQGLMIACNQQMRRILPKKGRFGLSFLLGRAINMGVTAGRQGGSGRVERRAPGR
jgi:hypothetical protein